MDCDIHAHFEIKIKNEWLHYSSPVFARNYDLFTKMAGVRDYNNGIAPISLPKGLPSDLSKITKLENKWWGSDGHSHSWLNAEEITCAYEFHTAHDSQRYNASCQWGYLHVNGWEAWLEHPSEYPKEIQDIRLVFWFDN